MPRARAVQTPGAAPADTTTADTSTTEDTAGDAGEVESAPKGKAPKGKLTREDYAKMHSTEVDAKTLTSSVLCKDGWVVPDLPPVAPVRA